MTLLLEKPRETEQTAEFGHEAKILSTAPSPDIADYYRQTIDDYQTWSRAGYMHFGIWRKWMNPLNRQCMLEAMNDLVFEALELGRNKSMQIADLGCGVGAVSRFGSHKFISHQWYPVTLSAEQIAFGQSMLDPLDNERIEFVNADYSRLPFESNSLDAAFFLESLCHAERPVDPLTEVARVLKPGGRLVVVDGMMWKTPEQNPAYVNRLSRRTAESWAVGEFHSVPQFENAVQQSGLEIDRRIEIGWQLAPCVAHSPFLIGTHALRLLITGKLNAWKRKHLVGCTLGVLLGMMRRHFGYFVYTIRKPLLAPTP